MNTQARLKLLISNGLQLGNSVVILIFALVEDVKTPVIAGLEDSEKAKQFRLLIGGMNIGD